MSVARSKPERSSSRAPRPAGCGRTRGAGSGTTRRRLVGFGFVGIFVLTAIFAPLLAQYSPTEQNLGARPERLLPRPLVGHLFGVDQLGRDELSRIIYGARYSLIIGVVAVATGMSVGLFFGAIAATSAVRSTP